MRARTDLWLLDDGRRFVRVASFDLEWASTYGDTRPGHTDREKRERIRERAASVVGPVPPGATQWAFRIQVSKRGRGRFDIENVPKLIIDAFCRSQIRLDKSPLAQVGLYDDDIIDHVVALEVVGARTDGPETTTVEVFASLSDR